MGERWWGFMGFADYSGDIQWTEEEIAPLGAASEILGAAIEREEKERALEETHATIRDQERFLSGVFDAIQDGIMVAAPDMTILRVNTTMEKRISSRHAHCGKKMLRGLLRPETPLQRLSECENPQDRARPPPCPLHRGPRRRDQEMGRDFQLPLDRPQNRATQGRDRVFQGHHGEKKGRGGPAAVRRKAPYLPQFFPGPCLSEGQQIAGTCS